MSTATQPSDAPLLEVSGLVSGYGHVRVLEGVSIAVHDRQIVTILGGNGAGKSTLLKTLSGLLPVEAGSIRFEGRSLVGRAPGQIVDAGLSHVAEGRRLFRTQSVMSNLELGLYGTRLGRAEEKRRLDAVLGTFPMLAERPNIAAGALSGGQQQMLAIARGLMSRPRLLMLDEPSLGLAPIVVDTLADIIVQLNAGGMAVLLVEQRVDLALRISQRAYVLETGRIVMQGASEQVMQDPAIKSAYLGL